VHQHIFGLNLICLLRLQVLVEDVVEADGAARIFSRWSEVLACGAAAWPELTRRWVMLQQQEGLASPQGDADYVVCGFRFYLYDM
jgi:hypothetical protein